MTALAFLLACSRLAAADAPVELRADNVNEAAELLVPSIRRWVERGDLTLRRGALRYSPRWDDPFLAASEETPRAGSALHLPHRSLSRFADDAPFALRDVGQRRLCFGSSSLCGGVSSCSRTLRRPASGSSIDR